MWAEAIQAYKDGETLFLSGEIAQMAYAKQQEAMESDDREGLVQDYLDRLLPENWDNMDLYQRRTFLSGGEFGDTPIEGTVRRDRVCVMEIWCECFGKERQNLRKADSYELEGILNKVGGWERYAGNASGKMRISGYGIQRAFIRNKDAKCGNS